MVLSCLWLALAATNPVLDDARRDLNEGQLTRLLFDLQGAWLEGSDRLEGAQLADQGAVRAQPTDPFLAFGLARIALRINPADPVALEQGARGALASRKFAAAAELADRWAHSSGSPEAELSHAQALLGLKQPEEALDALPSVDRLPAPLRGQRADLERTARQQVIVERQARATAAVVVYGASWCGACQDAKRWLRAKGVAFRDVDLDHDRAGRAELDQKARAAGVGTESIPILDVRGKLMVGFNAARLEALLR